MLSMTKRFDQAKKQFNADKLKYFISNIYKTDHFPSFHRFHQTADWIVQELKGMGVNARKVEYIANGKTKYSDWMLPKAWDAYDLKLKDLSTGEIIADYQKISTHMVMGSGSTPKEGLTGEVVYLEDPSEIYTKDVRHKFILSKFIPQALKKTALEKGALGFLFHGRLEDFQGHLVKWINAWSDDAGLWSQTDADINIPAISLSPDMVDSYRDKILSGKVVKFEVKVDTKFYDGTLPVVEAFIPGVLKDELFFTGHLFEQGANDNASGCATMMEIARVFSNSTPKRGLRFLFTSELYGTIPYSYENLSTLQNVIAGINIDSTAEVGRKSGKMDIIQNPNTNPSYVNLLIEEMIKANGKEDQFEFHGFLLDDNMVTDPQINIPCFLIGVCSFNWHTSNDTLDILDWSLFNQTTTFCIAWADFILNGDKNEALFLKECTDKYLSTWANKLKSKKFDASIMAYSDDLIQEVTQQLYQSINKIHQVIETTAPAYNELGPIRNYFGPPSYGEIKQDERGSLGMWNGNALFPQFWSNGKRSKDRIIAYTALEFNISPARTRDTFNTLYKNNYLSDSFTCRSLTIDMKRIGIKLGDIIIVHGSMKKIGGTVEGGPEAVIQALIDAVGQLGTIVFPTFVNLNTKTDLRTEPSRLGLLSETFRTWPKVKRSNNPTHCVSAIGKHAIEIISDHEKTSQLGINSPLHKASNMGAKVLHLGTGLKSCSLIHVGETIAKVPFLKVGYAGYDKEIFYISEDGIERSLLSDELPGDSNGFPKLLHLTALESKFIKAKIGNADSFLVAGNELLKSASEALAKDPYSILCENEKCIVCVTSRKCV
jgi:aminoglycoside 3-N-acetyltransferase